MAKKKDPAKKAETKKSRSGGDHVYKKLELVGSSRESIEDAVRQAVRRASKTMRNLDWFEVKEVRGWIEDGEVQHFQVDLQVGFRLDEE
jgi:flavin-binding protein dodecin